MSRLPSIFEAEDLEPLKAEEEKSAPGPEGTPCRRWFPPAGKVTGDKGVPSGPGASLR